MSGRVVAERGRRASVGALRSDPTHIANRGVRSILRRSALRTRVAAS